jgi:hypothetical protein
MLTLEEYAIGKPEIFMGLFDSDWQRLHKKISRQYELMALKYFESGSAPERDEAVGILTHIVREQLPGLSSDRALDFVRVEYKSFEDFAVRDTISQALKDITPGISEAGISEIFLSIRKRFHNSKSAHEYFLFFIISKLIELHNLSTSRGAYLIEISRGRIPKPSRLVRFFQMSRLISRYFFAKDTMKR